MNSETKHIRMGWLPDYPDFRDYTAAHPLVEPLLQKAGVTKAPAKKLPVKMDLRQWCSPVEDQGDLGSCTAHACIGIVEYFERRSFSKHIDASRLFLYKTTRNLMRQTGDTGAYLRTTMGALALFGVVPEEYWPYVASDFDKEPSAFCYSFAQNYQAITYYKVDKPLAKPEEILNAIKTNLAAGIPAMFGITVYSSIRQADATGRIPFPVENERSVGGHAIAAVGYDDNMLIKNTLPKAKETTGAFLIRNSWGKGWGEQGYGWLPYEYLLKGLAIDWWCLIKNEWLDTGEFTV